MTRAVLLIGLGLVGCARPEPEQPTTGKPAASAVTPAELEQVDEYVDPLEAARAEARAKAAIAADPSWREGFDNREDQPNPEGVDPDGAPSGHGSERPTGAAIMVEDRAALPEVTGTPTFTEPLPQLDGGPPVGVDGGHPPDAKPPVPRP